MTDATKQLGPGALHPASLARRRLHRRRTTHPGAPWRIGLTDNIATCSSTTPPTAGWPRWRPPSPTACPAKPSCNVSSAANCKPCTCAPDAEKACVSSHHPPRKDCFDHDNQRKEQCDNASNVRVASVRRKHRHPPSRSARGPGEDARRVRVAAQAAVVQVAVPFGPRPTRPGSGRRCRPVRVRSSPASTPRSVSTSTSGSSRPSRAARSRFSWSLGHRHTRVRQQRAGAGSPRCHQFPTGYPVTRFGTKGAGEEKGDGERNDTKGERGKERGECEGGAGSGRRKESARAR